MNVQQSDLIDPALVAEVDLARAAAQEEAGDERVGDYVEYQIEDSAAVTHLFEADKPGYRGWRWAVTITSAGPDSDITVSEVVLLPGPTALVAPEWIPWQQRVQAGDLGVGDLLPTSPDDPRLVPAYLASDDPAVEEVAAEAGLGRVRVMSRTARLDAADRWLAGDYGPRSDMARSAPAQCGTCGFYLSLAGALRAAFGTCGNEFSPADGHVVHVEYGCGAHSEAEVEQVSPVLVADLIYDDAQLDVEPLTVVDEVPAAAVMPESGVESGSLASGEAGSESEPAADAASVPGVTTSAPPEAVVSGDEASAPVEGASGESDALASDSAEPEAAVREDAAVESAGSAVGEASGESESLDSDEAGAASELAADEASVSGVTAPVESVAPEAAVSGDEASAVDVAGPAVGEATDAVSVSGVTAPVESVAPEAAVSGEEASAVETSAAGEPETAVESAGPAVAEASGEPESLDSDEAGAASEPAAGEASDGASVSGVTAPDESVAPEAAGSRDEASAVETPPGESETAVEPTGPVVDEAASESEPATVEASDGASVSGVTTPVEPVAPEAVASGEEASAVETPSGESASLASGEAGSASESPDGEPSDESGPAAAEPSGESVPVVTQPGSAVADGELAAEAPATAASGEESPVATTSVVEDAAPAAIEPVVTGETSPGDESASRE